MAPLNTDERHEAGEKVISVLENADHPISHEDLSETVDLDPDNTGEVVSDLVIANRVSTNAEWEYRLIE